MITFVNRMNRSLTVGYLYLTIGLLCVIIGVFVKNSTSNFIATAQTASGIVVELIMRESSLYPKIEFVDESNQTHLFESSYGCNPACYKEGETLDVLYVEGGSPKISTFISLWLPSLLLLGVGGSFILVSVAQIIRLRRKS